MAAASSTSLAAVLPDYEVTTELGRGAMGIVYLGRHKALDRTVAIKELPASFSADETVRSRFLDEARVVASLDHPHIVTIHDFVDRDGHLAIVMEHLPNGTVWDQFLHHGLAAPRACGLVLATLAGLHHAHDRGVMHRDIKPENLIFTHNWQLKVTDFGIAQVLTGDSTMGTEEGAIVGTPAYMSPEQAEGRSCGPPADVYASGAMLYEMLTGALPFPDATDAMSMAMARLSEDPVPIETAGSAVPDAIAEACMHALTRDSEGRFQSAEDFGVALGEAAAFTWGPEWIAESGTAVQGSLAIAEAARTTDHRRRSAIQLPADVDSTPTPAESDAPVVGDASAEVAATAPEALAPEPPVEFAAVPTAAVVPRQRERVEGADLNQLAPADIVNLKELKGPGPFWPALAVALICLALAAGAVLLGRGADPAGSAGIAVEGQRVTVDDPVEVDFTETFAVSGVSESLDASFLGIPLGSFNVESGQLDPDYLRWATGGVVEFSSPDDPELSFPVRATNSPYPTASFVAGAMIALGALASVQANLRGLRARRFQLSPFIGLLVSGALMGAAASVLAMLVLATPTNLTAIITAAALAAIGCAALGEAYRRWYRRRRLRRVTIARVSR